MAAIRRIVGLLVAVAGFAGFADTSRAADPPSAKAILGAYKPSQRGVDYEIPTEEELARCKVEVERRGKISGWVVYGPAGQLLRRFVDTDGDNQVDQFRYFNHGIEVYRDLDTNANNKVDQCRWVNLGGSRWGIDANEDGTIDSWKVLSAAEASREAIDALVTRDVAKMTALMVTADDLKRLNIDAATSEKILETAGSPTTGMRDVLSKTKVIAPKTKWMKFDVASPSRVPADDVRGGDDLEVYENAMAIVETGPNQSALVQIGEMIRVGEVWKLTQVPQPVEGESFAITAGGLLMQPSLGDVAAAEAGPPPTPEMQGLLEELQKLDETQPGPTAPAKAFTDYNARRADLLTKLVSFSKTDDQKGQWMRQLIDGLAAAVQTGSYPEGQTRLNAIEASLRESSKSSDLIPYVVFRRVQCDYTLAMQKEEDLEKRQDLQKKWLASLETFLKDYPKSEDAAEAMLQLAVTEEFNGRSSESQTWYRKLVADHASSQAGQRAAGALRRLDLKGKPFALSGNSLSGGPIDVSRLKGRVTLVLYWATWCEPCKEDLPALRAFYDQYKSKGFEIVGVCLDATREPVGPFLQSSKVTWPQIYEEGGFQSRPALEYGVISLPTMFLVDKEGRVASRNASVQELKILLPQLLAK